MKIQVISRKLIKPCTPTPIELQEFKISFMDKITSPMNIRVILYYSSGISNQQFEESLAKILPRFYPLAGRYIKEKQLVNCSDQGAEYVEAQVDCHLQEFINGLGKKSRDMLDLVPCDFFAADEIVHPLLAIQVSRFKCGGIAICFSVSHRVVDAGSVDTLIAAWTSAIRDDNGEAIFPVFDSPLHFPGEKSVSSNFDTQVVKPGIVSKRFLFDKGAMSKLRGKAMGSEELGKRALSRVRLVTALITKAVARIDQKKYGKFKDLLISHAVDIRGRTIPPLPKYTCGNLGVLSISECRAEQCQNLELQDIIHLVSDSITKTLADCAQILSDPEKNIRSIIETTSGAIAKSYLNDVNVLLFTDWSKFKFYKADFGMGQPVCVSVPTVFGKNLFLLMDNKDSDGIEAWINLLEEDMPYFEEDEDIKLFTI